jgi:hypothetical protein
VLSKLCDITSLCGMKCCVCCFSAWSLDIETHMPTFGVTLRLMSMGESSCLFCSVAWKWNVSGLVSQATGSNVTRPK